MPTVLNTNITTQAKVDSDHAQEIADNLKAYGHTVSQKDVIPEANKPIPQTPELKNAQAEIIGEDLTNLASSTWEDIAGGGSQVRVTKSGHFFGKLWEKLHKKKDP